METDLRMSVQAAGARGLSVVELMIVMVLIGIISAAAVPQLMRAFDRSRQRRTMADMRLIAEGNETYRLDDGGYAEDLANLEPVYVLNVPSMDAWGNDWDYDGGGSDFTLTSFGSDGVSGPEPPSDWVDEPHESDLILVNSYFTQAPGSLRAPD